MVRGGRGVVREGRGVVREGKGVIWGGLKCSFHTCRSELRKGTDKTYLSALKVSIEFSS